MEFKTIQNRNGQLLISSLVLTNEVMSVLKEFNQGNCYLVDQESLLCAIEDFQEESDIEKSQFNLCIAILVNSKVYLISNEEEFRDQLTRLDIDLYKDVKGCWKSSGLNDLDLCFIANRAA
jgi:hypothetical protein